MKRMILVAATVALFSATVFGKGGHAASHSSVGSSSSHRSTYTYGVARDSQGRIERSSSARDAFIRQTGYPQGRPGYVVDHIIPLKKGGVDAPSNMQWQTTSAAKAKDRIE